MEKGTQISLFEAQQKSKSDNPEDLRQAVDHGGSYLVLNNAANRAHLLDEQTTQKLMGMRDMSIDGKLIRNSPHPFVHTAALSTYGSTPWMHSQLLENPHVSPAFLDRAMQEHLGDGSSSTSVRMTILGHPNTPDHWKEHAILGCDSVGCRGCGMDYLKVGYEYPNISHAAYNGVSEDLGRKLLADDPGHHHARALANHGSPALLGELLAHPDEQTVINASERVGNALLGDDDGSWMRGY